MSGSGGAAAPPGARWAVLGTAGIARGQFLPALREAGGRPVVVASRDRQRAEAFAAEHGVERGVAGYEAALAAPDVDAVYVALPNPLHARWTTAALAAGKAVLCEKPLCVDPEQAADVLAAAEAASQPLWEAFVFPFTAAHRRLVTLLADGAIGEVREVHADFHFTVSRPDDIRLSAAMAGGALADVGVYPFRLAHELLASEPTRALVSAVRGREVEVEAGGVLEHPGARRLSFSSGFQRARDTTTVVMGSTGQVRLDNPWHPRPGDALSLHRPGEQPVVEQPTRDAHPFTAALRHVHAVLAGLTAPEHLARDASPPVARALALAQAAAAAPSGASRAPGEAR